MAEQKKMTRDVVLARLDQIEFCVRDVAKLCESDKPDAEAICRRLPGVADMVAALRTEIESQRPKAAAAASRPPAQLKDGEVPGRAEGSRALRGAGGNGQQRRERQPGDEGATFSGRPWKFNDGTYGVLLDEGQDGEDGAEVRITTRAGKEWTNHLREYVERFKDGEVWKVDGRRDS